MARGGTGTIPTGRDRVYVSTLVGATDYIAFVMTSDPCVESGGPVLKCILKDPVAGFTAVLSGAVQKDTTYDWKILGRRVAEVTIPAGRRHLFGPGVIPEGAIVHLVATRLPSEDAGGAVVEWVEKQEAGLTMHLTNPVPQDTTLDAYGATRTKYGTIPAGRDKVFVNSAIAAQTMIVPVLTRDPGADAGGANIEWIEKDPGTGYWIHLSNVVKQDTTFDVQEA